LFALEFFLAETAFKTLTDYDQPAYCNPVSRMKLLIFAHTPPPHHGQSYMVQLLLAGFGGDHRKRHSEPPSKNAVDHGIECYHVNARLSRTLEDIGEFRGAKLFLLMAYCLEALWCRFRYGVTNFYYIPAPGKKSALYRDWMVMFLCRPFFKKMIFHWHAAGLAKWLETAVQIRTRALTYNFLKNVDLSIVLSNYNRPDAEKLFPHRVRVVGNGIPDPCPDFEQTVLPRHRARFAARQKLLAGQSLNPADFDQTGGDPNQFKVLFLAHCTRGKGLFDALDGVAVANAHLARIASPIRVHLSIAGEFIDPSERAEFEQRIQRADLRSSSGESCVIYLGFVAGEAKRRVSAESDCFCFPTHYYAESFGLVVLEAMAFGLPIIASRWRSIPELVAPDYPGLIPPHDPQQIAAVLVQMISTASGESLRGHFLRHFTIQQHFIALAKALHSVELPAENISLARTSRVS
jgi:glycosyltransferase involved in cell wall biosynthesis